MSWCCPGCGDIRTDEVTECCGYDPIKDACPDCGAINPRSMKCRCKENSPKNVQNKRVSYKAGKKEQNATLAILGSVALVIGIVCMFVTMGLDVGVDAGDGDRVVNLGLMNDKQNYLVVSATIILAGAVFLVAHFMRGPSKISQATAVRKSPSTTEYKSSEATKKCPFCAELIKSEAIKCRYCGSDLTKE